MKFQDKCLCEKTRVRSINMVWSVSSPRITALSWRRTLHNSVTLWAMPCRTTQDGWVIVKSSDKTWSTGGGNGKPLQYSCCENPVNSDAKNPWTWCEELTHWKRPWCWERLKTGGEGGDRGWDGWMASLNQWTWVWGKLGRQWGTEKPGVVQSMRLQRAGHNLTCRLNNNQNNLWIDKQ